MVLIYLIFRCSELGFIVYVPPWLWGRDCCFPAPALLTEAAGTLWRLEEMEGERLRNRPRLQSSALEPPKKPHGSKAQKEPVIP